MEKILFIKNLIGPISTKNSCKEIVKIRDYNNLIHDFLNNSTSEENEI